MINIEPWKLLILISLILFSLETIIFLFMKQNILNFDKYYDNELMNHIIMAIKLFTPTHYAIYSAFYLLFLFIAYYLHFILSLIITIQLISISMDIYFYIKLKQG